MKILVFNGSPRREKSDTMRVTGAFLDGIRDVCDAQVETITMADVNLEFCRGCLTCMRNGGTCVIDDGMKELLAKIVASDVLLFSFPLYCYGMPAKLKALTERLLPFSSIRMQQAEGRYEHEEQVDCSHLKFVMISGSGFPNSRRNFEPAVQQFRLMFTDESTVITIPENPMFSAPEAASVTEPRLALIRKAGSEYAQSAKISDELLTQICSPMIPESMYADIVNASV